MAKMSGYKSVIDSFDNIAKIIRETFNYIFSAKSSVFSVSKYNGQR